MLIAAQQNRQCVERIDIEIGQQPDLSQNVVIQQVALVDDEQRMNLG